MNQRNRETICPICGKGFYPEYYAKWGWLIGTEAHPKPVCSYTCQRKWEKSIKPSRSVPVNSIPVRVIDTGEVFESISKCAVHLGTSNANIVKCIYEGKTHKGLHIEKVG